MDFYEARIAETRTQIELMEASILAKVKEEAANLNEVTISCFLDIVAKMASALKERKEELDRLYRYKGNAYEE